MEQDKFTDITLTTSQENILKQILSFIESPTERVFILKGYAGTGKTTLMRFLIQELEDRKKNYRLLASTGRAAKILSNLSNRQGAASTIHSLIYSFQGLNKEYDEKEEPVVDKEGQLFLVFEASKLNEEKVPETIYIIDEASMISDVETKDITQAKFGNGRLLKELLEYDQRTKSKFIFVGDPCQLPPIEEYYSPALMTDYFQKQFHIEGEEAQLTEIMRQKGTNGIIDASKQIRKLYNQAPSQVTEYGSRRLWGFLSFRQHRDISLHPNLESMLNEYVEKIKSSGLNSATCICRRNRDCSQLSDIIRKKLGFNSGCIQEGDLLMVIQNNLPTDLMNGDMIVIEKLGPRTESRAELTFRQANVRELFTGRTVKTLIIEEIVHQARLNLDSAQQQALFIDFIIRMHKQGITQKEKKRFYNMMNRDPYLNALRCSYGYAITCHKSQGGEWEDVYLHVPRNITMNPIKETYQWIYTAMTRAKTTLHMVDDFYIR